MFYDVFTLGIFLWLWVFGYLWWFRRGGVRGVEWGWRTRTGRRVDGAVEMASMMGVSRRDGFGRHEGWRHERTSEWVRTGRGHGRMRSESWERMRRLREAELEGEMRRLGMI